MGRVVIIEDNRDAANSLAHLLEMLGHEVRVSYSGPEGLKTVQDWLPEWVLCDIGLPGLDGWEIAKDLRKDPRTSGIHLVAVTSFGTLDDRARSREAGFRIIPRQASGIWPAKRASNHHLTAG
jgi:CheY-like chemotaxis protein